LIGFDVADRRTPGQAVILIHGIGEQTPGSTIRSFVEGVLHGERYLSKPDRFSPTLELRRLQTWADEGLDDPAPTSSSTTGPICFGTPRRARS
jgi:hypothetical protein